LCIVVVVTWAWGACAVAVRAADPEPRQPTWFEQVERDRDRGAGRIVDDATWQAQRFEERRDVRRRRAQPMRAFDTFEEDRERESQIEAAARRAALPPMRGIGSTGSVILDHPALSSDEAGLAAMAAVAAQDQRKLAEAKQTLERSLRAVDAAEARELRLLRRRLTREGKPGAYDVQRVPVEQRFEALRRDHRRAYDEIRQHLLDQPPTQQ